MMLLRGEIATPKARIAGLHDDRHREVPSKEGTSRYHSESSPAI